MSGFSSDKLLKTLLDTGRIFSSSKNFSEVFSELMNNVRAVSGAEGGSLYIYDYVSQTLKAVVLTNEPLGMSSVVEEFNALKMTGLVEVPTKPNSETNKYAVSVACYLENRKVLVPSLDDTDEYDFVNTRKFDKAHQYNTHNLLALPLSGHKGQIIGVLQLINCDEEVFSDDMQPFIDAFAGQISVLLGNALLVNESQELMAAIIQMIGMAIDEKSPHTAGHCQRVSVITMMIAEALEATDQAPYKDFRLTDEQRRELHIAALLHDIGKIITPIHILDKRTKLYTLDDKINMLQERLRSWQLTQRLNHLEENLRKEGLEHLIPNDEEAFSEDLQFIRSINHGELFVSDEVRQRLDEIAQRAIEGLGAEMPHKVIREEELSNLQIKRGTLNPEERQIMEDHVSISIRLLSSIPWPSNLQKVVEYAGAHHENMNGTGYPNKITGDQMSLPARVLGLADRFEGLSAPDRPYRTVKMTLSRAMKIMEHMAEDDEIDKDLFTFFKNNDLHLKYARQYLPADLIDC